MGRRDQVPQEWQAQSAFLMGCGVIILTLFMGGTFLGVSTGLLEPDEDLNLAQHIGMFLFGGLVTTIGTTIAWRMAAVLAGLPFGDILGVLFVAVRGLLGRLDHRSLLAALFYLPLLWAYWTPGAADTWWRPSQETLISLVVIEFLIIHGFPFLVFTGMLAHGGTGWKRGLPATAFVGLVLLYAAFAWGFAEGPVGVVTLGYLMFPNLLPFLSPTGGRDQRVEVVGRWLIRFVALFGTAMVLNERSLQGEGNLAVGAGYFAIVFLLEVFRIFALPLDLAEQWARLPEERRRRAIIS